MGVQHEVPTRLPRRVRLTADAEVENERALIR